MTAVTNCPGTLQRSSRNCRALKSFPYKKQEASRGPMTEPTQLTATYKEMYMSNGAIPGTQTAQNQQPFTGAHVPGEIGSPDVREVAMSTLDLLGDHLLTQIRAMQEQSQESPSMTPSMTPRRPDVRGVVLNKTDGQIRFLNPGKHSGEQEVIQPGEACMLMFNGATLAEQMENAGRLFQRYGLGDGITQAFIEALGDGSASSMIAECYGPEKRFEGAVNKLVAVDWTDADGVTTSIAPSKGQAGAFGVRTAVEEEVYQIKTAPGISDATLAGTDTVAENFQNGRIYIAVGRNGETGATFTKPIVPSRAKEFYGSHFVDIPTYTVDSSGALSKEQRATDPSWPAQ
jgi:hypothetical protein